MRDTLERLGDRMLSLVVPRSRAAADHGCTNSYFCSNRPCPSTYQLHRRYRRYCCHYSVGWICEDYATNQCC